MGSLNSQRHPKHPVVLESMLGLFPRCPNRSRIRRETLNLNPNTIKPILTLYSFNPEPKALSLNILLLSGGSHGLPCRVRYGEIEARKRHRQTLFQCCFMPCRLVAPRQTASWQRVSWRSNPPTRPCSRHHPPASSQSASFKALVSCKLIWVVFNTRRVFGARDLTWMLQLRPTCSRVGDPILLPATPVKKQPGKDLHPRLQNLKPEAVPDQAGCCQPPSTLEREREREKQVLQQQQQQQRRRR